MGAAGAEGRTMCRRSARGDEWPGLACEPSFEGSSDPRSAAGHDLPLIEDRPMSRVSGVNRAHLGNVG